MKEYTINDLEKEGGHRLSQIISKRLGEPYNRDWIHMSDVEKDNFYQYKLVEVINKNIELEERVNKQAETLDLQANINDEIIKFMRVKELEK